MIAAEAMTIKLDPVMADRAINQTRYESAEVPAKGATFLTDINGEDTDQIPADLLKRMGLLTGIEQGDWFPLTAEEQTYVGRETVTLALGSGEHVQAHMGYTALVDNRKFLAPTIEIPFDNRFEAQGTRSYLTARQCVKQSQALMEKVCRETGGHFAINVQRRDGGNAFNDTEAHGCFTCSLLIPLTYAQAHAVTFASWTRHLSGLAHRLQFDPTALPVSSAQPPTGSTLN